MSAALVPAGGVLARLSAPGLDNVLGIKIARSTLPHVGRNLRGVGRPARGRTRVTLYTGNDDHIVADLLTPFTVPRDGQRVTVRIRGGLLGHWAVWTRRAVEMLDRVQALGDGPVPADLLALDAATTDANAALFDARNDFHGVIAGLHEILRRQGLLEGIWCLDPAEDLGPGQAVEIDRVIRDWPELTDDAFVADNLARWLGDR